MGFGEARVQQIVDELENLPNKSLVLLEEPETSLHPRAQSRFGRYLVELAAEKHHQILITTHSDSLLEALSVQSIVFLQQTTKGTEIWPGVQPSYASGLFGEGDETILTVLVEDECAKAVLAEIVRLVDPHFIPMIRIVPAGCRDSDGSSRGSGKDAIRRVMETLKHAKLRLAAVLDGDETADKDNFIFTLPGNRPPEDEIFACSKVVELLHHTYNLSVAKVFEIIKPLPHQQYFAALGNRLALTGSQLQGELAREYVRCLTDEVRRDLVRKLKAITS